MNKIKISDISFCETDTGANVQGGFNDYLRVKLPNLKILPIFSEKLKQVEFKEKGDFLVKESVSPEGNVYIYEGVSKDGQSKFVGGMLVDGNTTITQAFSSSGTFKDL